MADADGSGTISADEFVSFLDTDAPETAEEEEKRKKLAGLTRSRSKKALAKQRSSYSHSNSNDHKEDLALLRRKVCNGARGPITPHIVLMHSAPSDCATALTHALVFVSS